MRVAAVALVLIVGAAIVLAFANTLNSWVLGGLLGGLAALLLSIPVSLALFTLLARRHDTFQRSMDGSFEDEPEFAEDFYDEHVVYETELSYDDEDLPVEPRARYLLEERRLPASGYLRLPAAGHSQAAYEDDQEPMKHPEPRNYPRQPRSSSRSQTRETGTQISQSPQRPMQGETRRQTSTHVLSQHQSEALRVARQEAQQPRSGSGSLSRRPQPQESRAQALQRARASRQLRTRPSTFRAQRPLDERDTWVSQQEDERLSWHEEEDFSNELATDQLSDSYQHYPRRASYPRQPRSEHGRSDETWHTSHEDEDELDEPPVRRPRQTSERMSGSLHNPLVRRAPYLYNDDPLREEFAQQLENDRPIRRRSSRYARHENDEEW